MPRLFQHKQHMVRMAGLFAVGIAGFVLLRAVFVPEGFGLYGHFRAGALADNRAPEPKFAGRASCADCHTDKTEWQKGSKHATVGCEACHGALGKHASGATDVKPARPDPAKVCLVCHLKNTAKPAKFPQVDPKEHMDGQPCAGCHDPHAPEKEPQKK